MKTNYIYTLLLGTAMLTFCGCNDFLDKEPESSVTPASYFNAEADLSAYTINLYGFFNTISPGSYGMSTFADDDATDNQIGRAHV